MKGLLKFQITSVDPYGWNGRDYHPDRSDVGLIVTPVSMEATFYSPRPEHDCEAVVGTDGRVLADALPVLRGDADAEESVIACWTCVTADGRVLQLMDHEVRVVEVQQ